MDGFSKELAHLACLMIIIDWLKEISDTTIEQERWIAMVLTICILYNIYRQGVRVIVKQIASNCFIFACIASINVWNMQTNTYLSSETLILFNLIFSMKYNKFSGWNTFGLTCLSFSVCSVKVGWLWLYIQNGW